MNRNDIITAEITGWSSDGAGIARVDGLAVFVTGGVPGDMADIRILKRASNHAFARVEALICPSPLRVQPDCSIFGKCGGCDLRHVSYETELEFKRGRVSDALARIGGVDIDVPPVLPSNVTEGYRNKAVYQLGVREGRPVWGFYRRRSHDILPCGRCLLQSVQADKTADAAVALAEELGLSVYDEEKRNGDLRWLMYRENACGEGHLTIVSSTPALSDRREKAGRFLMERCPWLVGGALCVNTEVGNAILNGEILPLFGSETLSDTLCGLSFEISPMSFYQINRRSAERVYSVAADLSGLRKNETVLDLYCGIGTLTLCLAKWAGHAVGAEIVSDAVDDARRNAARNGVTNAEFVCGDAADAVRALNGGHFDVVSVDPPRKGLSPETLEGIAALAPGRIIYVSCDPATLARDVRLFSAHGYAVGRVQPVDMFPRTSHVEMVVQLVL